MARSTWLALVTFPLTLPLFATGAAAGTPEDEIRQRDDTIAELVRRVDVLTEEVSDLRTQVAVPEEPTTCVEAAEADEVVWLGPARKAMPALLVWIAATLEPTPTVSTTHEPSGAVTTVEMVFAESLKLDCAAGAVWAKAAAMLADPAYDLVLLDELNIALKYQYVDVAAVVAALAARPPLQHVVITGRAAPQALIDVADTVTEMAVVKHAYQAGIKAQKGIEL